MEQMTSDQANVIANSFQFESEVEKIPINGMTVSTLFIYNKYTC